MVDPAALLLPLVGHAIHKLNIKISKFVLKRPFGPVSCVPDAVLPGSVNDKPVPPKGREKDRGGKKGKKKPEKLMIRVISREPLKKSKILHPSEVLLIKPKRKGYG